jgi:hypothetical protein
MLWVRTHVAIIDSISLLHELRTAYCENKVVSKCADRTPSYMYVPIFPCPNPYWTVDKV